MGTPPLLIGFCVAKAPKPRLTWAEPKSFCVAKAQVLLVGFCVAKAPKSNEDA